MYALGDPGAIEWGVPGSPPLVSDRTLLGLVDDWATFLQDGIDEIEARELEKRLSDGRPWGSPRFVRGLERRLGRELARGSVGRPRSGER